MIVNNSAHRLFASRIHNIDIDSRTLDLPGGGMEAADQVVSRMGRDVRIEFSAQRVLGGLVRRREAL